MGLFDWINSFFTRKNTPIEEREEYVASISEKQNESSFEKPNINELCANAFPSNTGLYPHEIHMLFRAEGYSPNGNNSFPRYWEYSYGIEDPQAVLNKLYTGGYIEPCSLADALIRVPMAEIREEIKHFGLPGKRKKKDMIDLLLSDGDIDYLNEKYTDRPFVYTEKGLQELKENEYIGYVLRMQFSDIDIWIANRLMQKATGLGYRDVIWGYFNKLSVEYSLKRDFGLARNVRLEMVQLCMDEEKWVPALQQLCHVFYCDLSSLHNGYDPAIEKELYKYSIKHYFPYETSSLRLAPGCVQYLLDIQDKLGIDDEKLREYILKFIPDKSLPFHLFTKEECVEIIMAEKSGDLSITNKISRIAKKRYIHRFK